MSHPSWMNDQVEAATRTMGDIIESSPRLHRLERGDLPENLDAMADLLADLTVVEWMNAGTKTCSHLRAGTGPQPTFIFVWDPSLARCTVCATVRDLEMRGTDLDFTCDACGVIDRDVEYYPLGVIKAYVTISGGICERCHDRAVGTAP